MQGTQNWQKIVFNLLSAGFLPVLFAACALKPTATKETTERKNQRAEYAHAFEVGPGTVVFDARSPFEYSLSHIPGAILIQWADFTDPNPAQRGVLQADLYAAARRLAEWGIEPSTQVSIVGEGLKGNGEEGRIAWMLAYLGVKDVRFADHSVYHGHVTNEPITPGPSVVMWKPVVLDSLNVTRAELQSVLNHRVVDKSLVYQIIDVRSAKDYLGREGYGAAHAVPNMDAINIPWREFFEPTMKPKKEILTQLRSVGVLSENRIIVLDADGVSSAAVTMALRALGYPKAGNYAGGLTDLLSAYQ